MTVPAIPSLDEQLTTVAAIPTRLWPYLKAGMGFASYPQPTPPVLPVPFRLERLDEAGLHSAEVANRELGTRLRDISDLAKINHLGSAPQNHFMKRLKDRVLWGGAGAVAVAVYGYAESKLSFASSELVALTSGLMVRIGLGQAYDTYIHKPILRTFHPFTEWGMAHYRQREGLEAIKAQLQHRENQLREVRTVLGSSTDDSRLRERADTMTMCNLFWQEAAKTNPDVRGAASQISYPLDISHLPAADIAAAVERHLTSPRLDFVSNTTVNYLRGMGPQALPHNMPDTMARTLIRLAGTNLSVNGNAANMTPTADHSR